MHNVNFFIDFVQSSKRQFVDATITDQRIKTGLYNFIDTQTELCKIINRNAVEFTKIAFESMKVPSTCKS